MLMGKVVGSVVSTRKNENLVGNKFMIVEVADHMRQGAKQIIAIDKIGAGIGEYVLVVQGRCTTFLCYIRTINDSYRHLFLFECTRHRINT